MKRMTLSDFLSKKELEIIKIKEECNQIAKELSKQQRKSVDLNNKYLFHKNIGNDDKASEMANKLFEIEIQINHLSDRLSDLTEELKKK